MFDFAKEFIRCHPLPPKEKLSMKKPRIYTEKLFRDNFTQEQLIRIYCKMNGWKTPEIFGLNKPLSKEEVKENMRELVGLVKKKDWLKCWQELGSNVTI